MAIETYTVNTADGTTTPMGDTPPPASAIDGTDSGVPGAPATPGEGQQDAGAPPAPPSPSPLGEGEGEAAEEDEPQAVTIDDFNRHMARLRRNQRKAERALEAANAEARDRQARYEAQIDTLTRLMQGQPTLEGTPPADPTRRPQSHEYTDQAAYDQAMDTWLAHTIDARAAQREQMTHQQRQLVEREAAFTAAHPDFDAVVRTGLAGKVAPHVQQALMLLPDGPAAAYALAKAPDQLQRLNQLPPPLVFAELGRLSPAASPATPASTNGAVSPTAATPPVLPPPLTPVSGQGSVPPGSYHENMSQAEYKAWRQRTSQVPRYTRQREGVRT